MRRTLAVSCLALASLVAVALGPAAAGAAPPQVKVGKVALVDPPEGAALLIPVTYPIQFAGRQVSVRVTVSGPTGGTLRGWSLRTRANAGARHTPERRKRFTFVHSQPIEMTLAAQIRDGATVRVLANGRVDVDGDGKAELSSRDAAVQPLTLATGHQACGSVPQLRVRPGTRVKVQLPPCSGGTRWFLVNRPERGTMRVSGGELLYRAPKSFRGTASATLMAGPSAGTPTTGKTAPAVPVQITVGSPNPTVVRVLGDSVTAGFGYYEGGELMGISSLYGCKPGATVYDDACSSNSTIRSNKALKVEYSADYGLANNVSWAAQWANAHGVTDFKNFAVSGSEPSDWFGKGQFAATTKQLAGEDPDYVLLTMGANPLLSNMLFGIGNIGCGIWSDAFGAFRECIEAEFAEIHLHANLKTLYTNLVKETDAEIFVMQYHLSIPTAALYTATQIAEMGVLINEEIAAVAKEVSTSRITVVSPPHFNTGLDIEPVYPAGFKCEGRFFTSHVDGRSVQSTISQDVMQGLHPLEFCPQAAKQKPWVISGDTGIHPSAAGYAQMASQVPAPE